MRFIYIQIIDIIQYFTIINIGTYLIKMIIFYI